MDIPEKDRSKHEGPLWVFRCDCGNTIIKPSRRVLNGSCTRCPECAAKEKAVQASEIRKKIELDENGRSVAAVAAIKEGRLTKQNSSGVRGVSWHKKSRKWAARIFVEGRGKTIGYFDTIEEAKEARMRAVEEVYR